MWEEVKIERLESKVLGYCCKKLSLGKVFKDRDREKEKEREEI